MERVVVGCQRDDLGSGHCVLRRHPTSSGHPRSYIAPEADRIIQSSRVRRAQWYSKYSSKLHRALACRVGELGASLGQRLRHPTEEPPDVIELTLLEDTAVPIEVLEVLHLASGSLGEVRHGTIVDSIDDVAKLPEHRVVEPRVRAGRCLVADLSPRKFDSHGIGLRGEAHASMQHVHDDAAAIRIAIDRGIYDTGRTERTRGALPHVGETEPRAEPGTHVQAVVAHSSRIHVDAARGLVLAEARREIGPSLLRRAPRQPRDVVHWITEVCELPVDDRGDSISFVEEVAGTGVALDEHGFVVAVGHVMEQMIELHPRQQVDRLVPVFVREHRLDAGQLVALVLPHRADGAEARQVEVAGADGVPRAEMAHEVLGNGHRDLGITWWSEPDLTFRPVDEEHVEVLIDAPDVRDRDAERLDARYTSASPRNP